MMMLQGNILALILSKPNRSEHGWKQKRSTVKHIFFKRHFTRYWIQKSKMVPRILQESFSTSTWRTQPATRLTVRCPEYEFALPEAIASRDISWDSQRGRGTCGRFGTPSRGTWTLILTVNQTSPYLKPILAG